MVEPEEDGQQEGKWDSNEDIAHRDIPEVDEPASLGCWHEGYSRRQSLERDVFHLAHMDKARKEDDSQGRAIVLEEDSHGVPKEAALT